MEAYSNNKNRPTNENASLAIIEIPHAGEVIKFDLDSQLEADTAGIIRILTAVKADRKVRCAFTSNITTAEFGIEQIWMMTAAHYTGKHNLESAKQVLEAGIDIAARVGDETDTKPFWHLLGQINGNLQALGECPINTEFLHSRRSALFSISHDFFRTYSEF